jgi:penicillin-binding protein 2
VENEDFGVPIAGPIASLMIEKYLRKKITRTDLKKEFPARKEQYAKLGGMP